MKVFLSQDTFLFRRPDSTDVGHAAYQDLKVVPRAVATPEEIEDMQYYMEEQLPGEEFKHPHPAVGLIILGPKREFTHAVKLRACGNPDRQQYADIGPKKTVQVIGIEEAQQVVKDYQAFYDMGCGNCAKDHGIVYEILKSGKRKKVGEVNYGGRYNTVAQLKAFEAEMKAKYGTLK